MPIRKALSIMVVIFLACIPDMSTHFNAEAKQTEKTEQREQTQQKHHTQQTFETIAFPQSVSLGTLMEIRSDASSFLIDKKNILSRQVAKGNVKVGVHSIRMLIGSYDLGQNMSLLNCLIPNDLQVLSLYRLEIKDTDAHYISRLKGLTSLHADDTDICDKNLSEISELSNLKTLKLSSTLITGKTIGVLAKLTKLHRLEMSKNDYQKGNLGGLALLQQVKIITLYSSQITNSDLKYVGMMKSLRDLSIGMNEKINDEGLKNLARLNNLRFIDVSNTTITMNGLKALQKIPLTRMIVDSKQFTPSQRKRIQTMFPNIDIREERRNADADSELFAPLH